MHKIEIAQPRRYVVGRLCKLVHHKPSDKKHSDKPIIIVPWAGMHWINKLFIYFFSWDCEATWRSVKKFCATIWRYYNGFTKMLFWFFFGKFHNIMDVMFYNPTEVTHSAGIANLDALYIIMWHTVAYSSVPLFT